MSTIIRHIKPLDFHWPAADPFLFCAFHKDDFPPGNSVRVKIIAGTLDQVSAPAPPPNSWAANPQSGIAIWLIEIGQDGQWTLPATEPELGRTLYFYGGKTLSIDGREVPSRHCLSLDSGQEATMQAKGGTANLLLLQDRPIGEPVAHYGPFVMNTRQELQQAFLDYQRDQFGGWPWDRHDQVHGDRGRFARYADGRQETRGMK